jgi:hypothetical protein
LRGVRKGRRRIAAEREWKSESERERERQAKREKGK